MGQDKDRKITYQLPSQAKGLHLWKLIYWYLNIVGYIFSTSPSPVVQGVGEWGLVVSLSHIVSAAPSYSGEWLITLFSCSRVESFPWDTVLHELPQYRSFPRVAVLRKILHHESLLWGAIFQELTEVSPTGSQVQPGICSRKGSPQAAASLRASTCSGTSWTAVQIPAVPWTSTGCRGISVLVPEVSPLPPHSLICGSLTYHHFSLQVLLRSIFYLFLNIFIELLLMLLSGSDLPSGRSLSLRDRWNWLCLTWGQPLASSHRNHPCNLPTSKPFHINLMQIAVRVPRDNK